MLAIGEAWRHRMTVHIHDAAGERGVGRALVAGCRSPLGLAIEPGLYSLEQRLRNDRLVLSRINGVKHYLWRAVDHEGEVLESFVTKRRDKKAALKFLRKSLRRHGAVETIVTDRLASYGAALKFIGAIDKRETGRWLNNRAENSHQPFRRRERAMLRFRRMRSLQKFAALHGSIHNHFNQERTLISRQIFKDRRTAALVERRQLCAA